MNFKPTKKKLFYFLLIILFLIIGLVYLGFFEKELCEFKGGKLAWDDSAPNGGFIACKINTDDYEKICIDDDECQGHCIINNIETVNNAWENIFGKEIGKQIDIEEFEEKSDIKIEGYCSEFDNIYCNNKEKEGIYVKKYILKNGKIIYSGSSWGMNCNNLVEL